MKVNRIKIYIPSLFKKNDDGYVIVAVLGVAFLAVIIVSSISAITISDLIFNAKVRAAIEARHSAESALDSYYAAINASDAQNILIASQNFSTQNDSGSTVYPIVADPTSGLSLIDTRSAGINRTVTRKGSDFSQEWFRVNDDGDLFTCNPQESDNPCFRMRLIENETRIFRVEDDGTRRFFDANDVRIEYLVDVVVMHKCTNREELTGCTFARFQQQFRQREFISHVMMSEREDIAPQVFEIYNADASVPQIAKDRLRDQIRFNSFAVGDALRGNLHTNDESFRLCRDVILDSNAIITSRDGQLSPVFSDPETLGFDECAVTTSDFSPAAVLPRQGFDLPTRAQDEFGTRLKAIAASENSNYVVTTSQISTQYVPVVFNNNRVSINSGPEIAIPRNGVIYVDGDIEVSGIVQGKVTVFSTGDIKVGRGEQTDLTYGSPESLTGLLARGDIILDCHLEATGMCRTKTVEALMVAGMIQNRDLEGSPGGSIYNNRWYNSRVSAGADAPILTVEGALISGYRGTFGAMSAQERGGVTSGWEKNFIYDSRLRFEQPPFMLRDSFARYIRSTSKDLPCEEEICTSNISN